MPTTRALILLLLVAGNASAELAPVVPHPEHQPRVYPRRLLGISTHFAGAVGDCAAPCEGVESLGYAGGVTGVVRPSRGFAVIVGGDRAWFRWQPPNGDSLTVHETVYRLGARYYLLDSPRFDGWLEASVTLHLRGATGEATTSAADSGLGAGLGLDVFVWDHVRLGPYARQDVGFYDSGPKSGGGAVAPPGEPLKAPVMYLVLQFGLAATVTFGPRTPP